MPRIYACFALVAITSLAHGQSKIETEIRLDFASKYVWHGLNLVNDSVLQPNVTFSANGFFVSVWSNFELTNWNEVNYDRSPKGRFTEFDTTLEYTNTIRSASWKAGVVDYQYPGTGLERYQEWFAGLAWENAPGSPTITLFKGSKSSMGSYALLGVSHSVSCKKNTLDLSADIGFGDAKSNNFYYGNETASFTYAQLSASTDIQIGKGWTMTPSLYFSTLLNRRHLEGAPRRTNLWLQLGVSTKF
jgi:hypothetical protein